MNEDLKHKDYVKAITLTKRRLEVGKKYSPYLINKDLIRRFCKTKNVQGILILNELNYLMGKSLIKDKQYHFDYLMNSPLTHKDWSSSQGSLKEFLK